jgi:hypothetical protein
MKALLVYVWLAGDGDVFAAADMLPPLLQPGNTSRAGAPRAAMTASQRRVIDIGRYLMILLLPLMP